MPEGPASVMKVVSSALKQIKYRKQKPSFETETDDPKTVRREEIELQRCQEGKLAYILHNVFTKEECQKMIKDSELRGFSKAMVFTGDGRRIEQTETRNNYQNIWESENEALRISNRLRQFVPGLWKEHKVIGLNERLRFQRYDAGQYFKPHFDATCKRENGERSYLSVQIFLNEEFRGGNTTFLDFDETERIEVEPKTGSVLVYQHDILHEDSKLISGRKYTLRTEIMYSAERIEDFKELRKLKKLDKGKFGMCT